MKIEKITIERNSPSDSDFRLLKLFVDNGDFVKKAEMLEHQMSATVDAESIQEAKLFCDLARKHIQRADHVFWSVRAFSDFYKLLRLGSRC